MPPERWRYTLLADPALWLAGGSYAFNRFFLKHWFPDNPWIIGQVDDFFLVPAALPVFLWVYWKLGLRCDDRPPRPLETLLHWIMWSLFFEWTGPHVLHHGVSDWKDVVAYGLGGMLAQIWWSLCSRFRPQAVASN